VHREIAEFEIRNLNQQTNWNILSFSIKRKSHRAVIAKVLIVSEHKNLI